MPVIDDLQIRIQGDAVKANDAIDKLVGKLDRLSTALSGLSGKNLSSLSTGVTRLSGAMTAMNNVKTTDFTRLAKNITKLANLDSGRIGQAAGAMHQFVNSLESLNNAKISYKAQQIAELSKGIAKLGYKSSTKAIENIPQLAQGMAHLMTTLSKAPKVSQNLIDMTNALAKLSRTGSSSGKAANSLSSALNKYTASTTRAKKGTFSLASAIGKLYATYWLLFRAFGKIKDAIDISSQLTEVQNVVDVTFGKYSNLVDKMSEISINEFGMSELTVKQVASRFQAMGTAMGFAQGEMADMSIELTKLTADMASFYNVEQDAVAEDLAAIFTGQTRPLRQYGIDLTQATLQEWALKQGMDANIKSMSQAEKTMLRYQYVLANTGAAQGDFLRTADTWANQTRILKQNFQQLGAVIGGTFINALKPMVKALNSAMSHIIAFAKTVSNALGKIFGWTYEESGGGIANDMEYAADSSEDLAGGLSDAEKNAKKLKSHLLGIDELNVLEPDTGDNSSGSGGGSGAGAGGAGADGGQWVKTDSILKNFESELDTLYKLGDYIGKKLTETLNGIDWENTYEGARNWGKGLADFLNGLISPDLFKAVGKTIAGSLNTSLHFLNSFGKTFEWEEFGASLSSSLKGFFENWDAGLTGETLSTFAKGILESAKGAIEGLKEDRVFKDIGQKIVDFICGIDWMEISWDLAEFFESLAEAMIQFPVDLAEGIAQGIADKIFGEGKFDFDLLEAKNNSKDYYNLINPKASFAEKLLSGINISSTWLDGWRKNNQKIRQEETQEFSKFGAGIQTVFNDYGLKISENSSKTNQDVSRNFSELRTNVLWETENMEMNSFERFSRIGTNITEQTGLAKTNATSNINEINNAFTNGTEQSRLVVEDKYALIEENIRTKTDSASLAVQENFKNIETNITTKSDNSKKSVGLLIDEISDLFLYNGRTFGILMPTGNISSFIGVVSSVIGKLKELFSYDGKSVNVYSTIHYSESGRAHGGDGRGFATGGFPEPATYFWAGENGVPEILGTVGGRTAVAGGAEITGIRDAVYDTGEKEASLLRTAVSLLEIIASKEMSVSISDRDVAMANRRGEEKLGYNFNF